MLLGAGRVSAMRKTHGQKNTDRGYPPSKAGLRYSQNSQDIAEAAEPFAIGCYAHAAPGCLE